MPPLFGKIFLYLVVDNLIAHIIYIYYLINAYFILLYYLTEIVYRYFLYAYSHFSQVGITGKGDGSP